MCYEFERLYWLQRAEALRSENKVAASREKPEKTSMPAKPAAPETAEQPQPVPV